MPAFTVQRGVDVAGINPALLPYIEYACMWMKWATGGTWDGRTVSGGITPTITSGYRSIEKQAQLYADRASNPYPVSRPGNSAHNYGMAFDSDVPPKYMPEWIAIRRAVGFTVPANDEVHGEVPGWRSIVDYRGT